MHYVDPVSRQSRAVGNASRLTLTNVELGGYRYDIPLGMILALVVTIVIQFVFRKTTFGYELKAVGFNRKAAQYAGSFEVDPFEGLPVVFNNSMTAYNAATTGVAYAIVGDFGHGALMNFPAGEDISFKFDDLSLKKQDLIEVMGRMYVGLGVVAPNAFVKITK